MCTQGRRRIQRQDSKNGTEMQIASALGTSETRKSHVPLAKKNSFLTHRLTHRQTWNSDFSEHFVKHGELDEWPLVRGTSCKKFFYVPISSIDRFLVMHTSDHYPNENIQTLPVPTESFNSECTLKHWEDSHIDKRLCWDWKECVPQKTQIRVLQNERNTLLKLKGSCFVTCSMSATLSIRCGEHIPFILKITVLVFCTKQSWQAQHIHTNLWESYCL